jgi:hypothetical protein
MNAKKFFDSVGVQTWLNEVKPPASHAIFKGSLSSKLDKIRGANSAREFDSIK